MQTALEQRIAALEASPETPVRKQFTVDQAAKAIDEENRTARFVITTGSVDRDNDTIAPSGWQLSAFLKSPSVLWAHDYSQLPVAKALSITATPNGLESLAQFPPKGTYPFADTVFELLKGGFLNATSVGFRPLKYAPDGERGGINFTEQELLEFSIVPVPANAEALVVARSKGIDTAPILAWAKDVCAQLGTVPRGTKQVVRRAEDEPDADDESGMDMNAPEQHCSDCGALFRGEGTLCAACKPKAMKGCGACGTEMDGDTCPGCGWRSPEAEPTTAPVQMSLVASVLKGQAPGAAVTRSRARNLPAQVVAGKAVADDGSDPVRWNRTHSKAFDVEGEPMEPSRLEIAWASRYLEVPVQRLGTEGASIPSARLGSFLAALDETLSGWTVDALRRMTEGGREMPPEHETIQLNSRLSRSFMVDGIRFMRRADGVKMVLKLERHWFGLSVTTFGRQDQAEVREALVSRTMQRAAELNYLKGEAFTLSGEFLDRGDLDWPALFLDPAKEAVLRRTVERVNDQGEAMESRGLMLMGPPGTGKTLFGRVALRQADATFIWISARDFYRSGSFGAFTYAFDLAAECAPTVLFFEDVDNWIDAATVDLLKTEMDGLKRRKGIQTILTTNFPELIPDALIDRPGRFHDLLELALPPEAVRLRMLAAWAPEAPEAERAQVAAATDGLSGAHLRELANFARTLAAEERLAPGTALVRALAKVTEQRELVAALRQGPDYRPRRQVRALVARTVTRTVGQADKHESTPERASQDESAAVLVLSDAPAVSDASPALRLTDGGDDGAVAVTHDEIAAALRGAIGSTVSALVRNETAAALARMRGRVD